MSSLLREGYGEYWLLLSAWLVRFGALDNRLSSWFGSLSDLWVLSPRDYPTEEHAPGVDGLSSVFGFKAKRRCRLYSWMDLLSVSRQNEDISTVQVSN